jgi:hypothetical protein
LINEDSLYIWGVWIKISFFLFLSFWVCFGLTHASLWVNPNCSRWAGIGRRLSLVGLLIWYYIYTHSRYITYVITCPIGISFIYHTYFTLANVMYFKCFFFFFCFFYFFFFYFFFLFFFFFFFFIVFFFFFFFFFFYV